MIQHFNADALAPATVNFDSRALQQRNLSFLYVSTLHTHYLRKGAKGSPPPYKIRVYLPCLSAGFPPPAQNSHFASRLSARRARSPQGFISVAGIRIGPRIWAPAAHEHELRRGAFSSHVSALDAQFAQRSGNSFRLTLPYSTRTISAKGHVSQALFGQTPA